MLSEDEQLFYDALKHQIEKGYLGIGTQSQSFLVADQRDMVLNSGRFFDLYFRSDAFNSFLQLQSFVNSCHTLSAGLNVDEVRRIQLIYRIGIHTLTIDFRLTNKNMNCFVLDAVNSSWVKPIVSLLFETHYFDHIYAALPTVLNNTPQDAEGNCHFFAMEHAKAALEGDIYALLAAKAKKNKFSLDDRAVTFESIDWNDLPPVFVKDAETRSFLENYMLLNPSAKTERSLEGEQTLLDYVGHRSDHSSSDSTYLHFPNKPFSIVMTAIQSFFYLQERLPRESPEQVLELCKPREIMTNSLWRDEQKAVAQLEKGVERAAMTFDDAKKLYVEPYDTVPGNIVGDGFR